MFKLTDRKDQKEQDLKFEEYDEFPAAMFQKDPLLPISRHLQIQFLLSVNNIKNIVFYINLKYNMLKKNFWTLSANKGNT